MPRGAKLLSSDDLKVRGAKPHRVKKRLALEQAKIAAAALAAAALAAAAPPEPQASTGPDPTAVAAYGAAVEREIATFAQRRVDGESITREYGAPYHWKDAGPGFLEHGAKYNFNEGSLLRRCRDYATEVLADSETVGTYRRELCERFLADISNGCARNRYYDVVAVQNVEYMLHLFADRSKYIPWIRILAMVEFASLKNKSGEYLVPSEDLLNFHGDDIRTMDSAILAVRATAA